jgi:TonB family protein
VAAGAWLAAAPPAAAQQAGGVAIYEPPAVDEQPRLLNGAIFRQMNEWYPPALLAGRVSGAVFLRFRILTDGSVDSVSALQATDAAFVEPAKTIARRFAYTPAKVGGRPVTVWHTFDLRFLPTPRTVYVPGDQMPVLQNDDAIDRLTRAQYPPALRAGGVAGAVLVRFRVLTDGRVDSASVLPLQSPHAALVEPAVAVARRLAFRPAQVGGCPVEYWHSFNLLFDPREGVARGGVERAAVPPPPPAEGCEPSAAVEQPRLLNAGREARRIAAVYPSALADSGIEGQVLLRFRVLANGRVDPESVSAVRASNPAFAEAATMVVREMRFRPARGVGGRPVIAWAVLPINFRLPPRPAVRPDSSGRGGARP